MEIQLICDLVLNERRACSTDHYTVWGAEHVGVDVNSSAMYGTISACRFSLSS
jgi:hypothetical protein